MILSALRVLFVLIEVLLLFNLLIVVHELGHFLAARWRGLYIEKFGIWFGKPLWKKTVGGVEYSLGSLPFGGFVALPQLAPMDIIEGKADVDPYRAPTRGWRRKSVRQLLILPAEGTAIDKVEPSSPAAKAGLQPGDVIRGVNGVRIFNTAPVMEQISKNAGSEISLQVE